MAGWFQARNERCDIGKRFKSMVVITQVEMGFMDRRSDLMYTSEERRTVEHVKLETGEHPSSYIEPKRFNLKNVLSCNMKSSEFPRSQKVE